ncbi:MAG: HEAT repeat domain-containing protein [Cyanobacteria bacterium P01_A01_bin.83]
MKNSLVKTLLNDICLNDYDKQISAIKKLQELNAEESIIALINIGLSSPDDRVRDITIEVLQQLGENQETTEICFSLTKSLADSEYLNRSDALDALASLNCTSAIPAIQNLLRNDSEWLVRVSAIEALVQLCDDSNLTTIKELENALEDPCATVRSYAAWGIGMFRRKELIPKLQKCFLAEKSLKVRIDILAAKYRLGVKEDLENIINTIQECDESSARKIVNVLFELSEEEDICLQLKDNLSLIIASLKTIQNLFPIEHNHVEQFMLKLKT